MSDKRYYKITGQPSNGRIQLIKFLRNHVVYGLKEAKDLTEQPIPFELSPEQASEIRLLGATIEPCDPAPERPSDRDLVRLIEDIRDNQRKTLAELSELRFALADLKEEITVLQRIVDSRA